MPETPEGRRVLIAEEDFAQGEILEEALALAGHRTARARNPNEVVRQLMEGPRPDVVLMNVAGVLSAAVSKAMATLTQRPAVVLVSGDTGLAHTAARLRADAFIRKPYELRTLLSCLNDTAPRAALVSQASAKGKVASERGMEEELAPGTGALL